MGPCESQCPARVLAAIEAAIPEPPNEWAAEWRARCRRNIELRAAAAAVKPGAIVRFPEPLDFGEWGKHQDLVFVSRSTFVPTDGSRVRFRVADWRTRYEWTLAA
jgi:hypothetical protein